MRGSVFAFEAFLMAGGWLVFGDAQQLWTGGAESRYERGSEAHQAKDGAKRRSKFILRTLKNTSQITVLNQRSETLDFLKSRF